MKKNRSGEKPPAEFSTNPFKSLKGFKPQSPGTKPVPVAPKKPAPGEDEEDLFLRSVSGVRRLESGEADARPRKEKIDHTPGPAPVGHDRLFLEAMQKIGTTMKEFGRRDEELPEEPARSASSRMRRLKRGTIRISAELDLHGCLRDEALVRLEHFISAAYQRGQEAVLVITGKGVNSPEGPVLQGAAAAWLRDKGKGMVAEFSAAPRDKGGSGAFVVFLKKKQGR